MRDWGEDFLYPTRSKAGILAKYRDFLSKIYAYPLAFLSYVCMLKSGDLFCISSDNALLELFLDVKGYRDSPFFAPYQEVTSGYQLAWPGYSEHHLRHNHYESSLGMKFGIDITFCIREKYAPNYQSFLFEFIIPTPGLSLAEKRNLILMDYLNNMNLVNACLEQFKKEFYPIIYGGDLFRVDLEVFGRKPDA